MAGHVDALSLGESNAGRPTDPDLMDIRQQLQYLRNELSTQVRIVRLHVLLLQNIENKRTIK
ncbi:hypothetical protein DPMN_103060 [Dreissena polymorpha]|uniref:Uncharacterized protein n=1 Tax=Dreissena polymorpha TaxID=45954 RepID=A0A9D4H5B3_DREPO|nr:hypothetical protein DPMN_103060 [Dreissena polymorpha]